MRICAQSHSLVKYYGAEDAYQMLSDAGFEAIDWNIDTSWDFSEVKQASKLENLCIFEKSPEEISAHFQAELAVIRKHGLEISQAHAPFECFAPQRPDVTEYAIRVYKNIIPFLDSLGCRHLIVHGATKNEQMDDLSASDVETLNLHMYESLIPELQKTKQLRVCLENLPTDSFSLGRGFWEGCCSDPHTAAAWVDTLNAKAGRDCFGICLDTGHLNVLRKPFYSYVPVVGSRLIALHLHDNLQNSDSHLMPYVGSVRWKDLLLELRKIGYSGDISFETCAQLSKNRLPRALTPAFLSTIAEIGRYFRSQLQG